MKKRHLYLIRLLNRGQRFTADELVSTLIKVVQHYKTPSLTN